MSAGNGLVTFDEIVLEQPDAADLLVAEVVDLLHASGVGFASATVHLSMDRHRLVVRAEWPDPGHDAKDTGLMALLAAGERMRAGPTFVGHAIPGLHGPNAGHKPRVAAIATRHLRDRAGFEQLMALLSGSGRWKRDHPGFIEATPHLGLDERTFVNYPMWTDLSSFQAWMADPRIAEGQEEVARLEVAPPSYVVCVVVAHIASQE